MFEEIITSKEVKFNNLEKKVYKFVCFFGCLIIKLMLEAYDRKLMENRDKKKYRHKGLRETSVNTVMGEIKYKRVMYEIQEEGITKTVYLLDETLKISVEGKVSSNLVEKVIETVPVTDSYRKAEEVIDTTTNTSLCHEKIREIILKIGDKITNKEKEERKKRSEQYSGSGNPMYGVHRFSENAPTYGKKHTDESKTKMSKTKREMPNENRIPVLCIETNTIYSSSYEASRQTGICQQNIAGCCRHEKHRKTAGDYHWEYIVTEEAC